MVPLVAGTALLGWAVAEHYAAAADESWSIGHGLQPEYLVTDGPYRFSRNPMDVGGVAIWGGWALLLGSAPVAAGQAILTGMYRLAVAWDDRTLEQAWGDAWRDYATRTSRWVARG